MEKFRHTLKVQKERAILVGAIIYGKEPGDNLVELTALAESAGAVVVDHLIQKIHRPHPVSYIGKGKAEHLAERVVRSKADVVIFDNDLSPRQLQRLEEVLQVKVLDRSELILDIFATRAQTRQAKLQVELAQLEYTYPRLKKMWGHLDSVAGAAGGTGAGAVGGVGTRGTGEKQLEIDRRLVQKKITDLKLQLDVIDQRKIHEINGRSDKFKVSLVGYTNTGKSTMLNKLTGSDVFVEDRLFATLDTRTKKWQIEKGLEILLSDTVGFIKKLPHHLVASFRATLEEAINADLLLHVVDASNEDAVSQIEAVNKVLTKIGCKDKPVLLVLNKVDVVKAIDHLEMLQTMYPEAVSISAKTGYGLEKLSQLVTGRLTGNTLVVQVMISQSNGKVQSFLRANGTIIEETYLDGMVVIKTKLGKNHLANLKSLRPGKLDILEGSES